MYEAIIITTILVACIGILLFFVGWINTVITALGNKEYVLAIFIWILNPLAIYYCIKNWDIAKTQGKQLIIGLFIMCITIIPAYIYFSTIKTALVGT